MLDILSFIPPPMLWLFSFLLGVIIGSFLNVYIYRLHTGKSLSGSSHCLSCGTSLKSYELIPLFSYLGLRGKCRTCGSSIPARYFLVELLTGVLFLVTVLFFSNLIQVGLVWWVMALLVVVAVYDLYHMIIPDRMVLWLLALAFVWQGYLLYIETISVSGFGLNFIATTIGSLFLFLLWWLSKGKWIGFGDVKLCWPLGLLVGYLGVFSMLVLSFWIGAIVGITLLAFQKIKISGQPHLRFFKRQLTIKSAVPFAPFLILGFLAVFFLKVDVVALITYVP
ncbi:MAG: prepilin peptidase [Candidatus Paceibacterota bacterium]